MSERPRDAPASVPRDVSPPTDEGRRCGDAVLSGLCRAGLVWPLDLSDPAAVARWQNADLASMVEGAFEERWLPEALVGAPRAYWRDRLSGAYRLPEPRDDEGLLTYLWLLEGGEAVGTMAVPALRWSPSDLAVWSLYVHPEARGAGVATRVLEAAYRLAVSAGLRGIRLETYWAWQRSLRFYLDRGFWSDGWGQNLRLVWRPELRPYVIRTLGDDLLEMAIASPEGPEVPLLRAWRDGPRLGLERLPEGGPVHPAERVHAGSTMALHLAARGWPLVRDAIRWAERRDHATLGEAEGLAYRILGYEARARRDGWVLRTPRIPGLPDEP